MAMPGRVAPVSVPLPRNNPFRDDDIGAIPAPPAGPAAAGAMPVGPVDPTQQIADINAAAVGGGDPAAMAPAMADEGIGPIPPADDYGNVEWSAAARAMQMANDDDSGLVGALRGFINAQAAQGDLREAAEEKALREAREAEMYGWQKEDRRTAAEDRERERLWATEDRDLSKEDRARKMKFEIEDRAMDRERFNDQDRMNDYDLVAKGVAIENAMEKAQRGELDSNALSRLEYARKLNLEAIENNIDLSPEQAAAERARVTEMYDQARDELMAVNAQARGMAEGAPGAEAGDEDMLIPELDGEPGEGGADETDGGQPGATSDNNVERTGPYGAIGDVMGWGEKPAAPAARKPSDVFPAQGEFSGAGTPDDPIIGAPDDPEAAKQWQKLYVKPGQVFIYKGRPYKAN